MTMPVRIRRGDSQYWVITDKHTGVLIQGGTSKECVQRYCEFLDMRDELQEEAIRFTQARKG